MKADNEINVTAGTINIESGDDGLHANNGTYLENEQTGLGDVNISGGTITVASDDDGLHADRYLNISGGTINVTKSYEGLEGNQIVFSGGNAYVYGSDDGVNAGNTGAGLSPKITVSGGLLFAAVPANGDTDGVDSNGDIELSGGTLIACGPTGNAMASAFDADGKCSMTGQSTLILFGGSEKVPSLASGISKSTKSGSYSSGKAYTIAYNEASFVSGKLISGYSSITSYSYFGAVTSVAAV